MLAPWKESYDQPRQHIQKQRHYFANKGPSSQGYILIAEPERQEHLWNITREALQGFREMGFEIGHTETPIIPLFIRDNNKTFAITRDLLEEGIFVNPVVSPAVAPNDTLIRFSLMATHTHEQVSIALEKIQKVFRSYGLVP